MNELLRQRKLERINRTEDIVVKWLGEENNSDSIKGPIEPLEINDNEVKADSREYYNEKQPIEEEEGFFENALIKKWMS